VIDEALAARFETTRVAVVGGLGFIGSNLARELVAAGVRPLLLDALVPGHGGSFANVAEIEHRAEIVVVDVRDPGVAARVLRDVDVVFNLVGQTSHIDSMADPMSDLEINCRAQLAILEEVRAQPRPPKVVFAGTRQIYGRPLRLPVNEDHPIAPVDVNGIHKAAAEWYHLLYARTYALRTCVLRLTNTYGPRMRVRDARQTFLGVWLMNVLRGREIEVWGDGSQLRDLTYVDDAVRALMLAAVDESVVGGVFNVGGDRSISLRELAELVVAQHGSGSYRLVPFPPDRLAIDIGDYVADDAEIRARLGWQPTVSLEDGIARTLEFYRERGDEYWRE
jgi:UDP-glucose 4-epimerase